jgi:hypothetical protein
MLNSPTKDPLLGCGGELLRNTETKKCRMNGLGIGFLVNHIMCFGFRVSGAPSEFIVI